MPHEVYHVKFWSQGQKDKYSAIFIQTNDSLKRGRLFKPNPLGSEAPYTEMANHAPSDSINYIPEDKVLVGLIDEVDLPKFRRICAKVPFHGTEHDPSKSIWIGQVTGTAQLSAMIR